MALNPDFWAGKRVFLTGHTGFKGSWLSLWLQRMGAEVSGYSLAPPTTPSLFELARVGKGMASILGDIRDADSLSVAMKNAGAEVVFHLAAQSLVRPSYADPVDTYSTNVMGTVNLLEAVRRTPGIKAVIVVTSDKCYENREWVWGYRENDAMGGYDPYSSSKGCAELVSSGYRSSFFNAEAYARHGVALATVRAGNVIGGGDWATDRLIPDILSAFMRNEQVRIRNPHAIRPWQHVLEPLRGYLDLAERLLERGPEFAEAWNFGPADDDVKPVQWIVEQMAEMWGGAPQWEVAAGDRPHEATYLKLDTSKARSRLDWKPRLCLVDALMLVVEWARAAQEPGDIRDLCMRQIAAYQSLNQQ